MHTLYRQVYMWDILNEYIEAVSVRFLIVFIALFIAYEQAYYI